MAETVEVNRTGKRELLMQLVARLGIDSTAAEIREHAYREGIGQINSSMLAVVRNEVFPERPKRSSNHQQKNIHDTEIASLITCRWCNSTSTKVVRTCKVNSEHHRKHLCKECGGEWLTKTTLRIVGKPVSHAVAASLTEKKCTRCTRTLPISCFGKRSSNQLLHRSWCKECGNTERRTNYGPRSMQKLYGITVEDYQRMMADQGSRCAICRNPESGKRGERGFPLSVDHCHKTGKVRGLLCSKCNLGIGNFNDDIAILEASVKYLCRFVEAGT